MKGGVRDNANPNISASNDIPKPIVQRQSQLSPEERFKHEEKKISESVRKIMNGNKKLINGLVGLNPQMQKSSSPLITAISKDIQSGFPRNFRKNSGVLQDEKLSEKIRIIEKIKGLARKAYAIQTTQKRKIDCN